MNPDTMFIPTNIVDALNRDLNVIHPNPYYADGYDITYVHKIYIVRTGVVLMIDVEDRYDFYKSTTTGEISFTFSEFQDIIDRLSTLVPR